MMRCTLSLVTMLYQIVALLLEVAVGLLAGACLLRLYMQWQRIPMSLRSGNPLAKFIFTLTDWLVLPLARPGFLTASVISAAVANRLPGPGTVYLGQQLRFRAPVRPGDTVQATVTVKSVDLEKARAVLETVCYVKGKVVIDGEATVMTTSSVRRARAAASA